MKKICLAVLIITTVNICYAHEQLQTDKQEIRLDTNLPSKTYNLNRVQNYNNKRNYDSDDDNDNDSPFNFTASPLQLLKQYQQDQL
jgi:glycogen synthase